MNNKNPRTIHETVLRDIMDIWDGIKGLKDEDFDSLRKSKGPMTGKSSIAKASSNLNLVFPVICSKGISIENASMISKAVEKNAVTMLQRLFASWQLVDDKNVSSVEDYVKKFHSNISTKVANLDDIFELSDSIEDKLFETVVDEAIRADLKNINNYLPTSVNESSLLEFSFKNGSVLLEKSNKNNNKVEKEDNKSFDKEFKNDVDSKKTGSNTSNIGVRKSIPTSDELNANDWRAKKDSADYFKSQVLNTEYKKANELMPTTMVINFKVKKSDGEPYNYENAVIGVKAKLYPISSDDIVKHISEKNIDKNWLTNFFRATTREISFMKDFVLALDKAKIDAMSLSARKSSSDRMWKVLERRATVSRLKKIMHQSNGSAAAITTLCISQEEVEFLRKNYNVDVERISTIINLFSSLNLMCICIVDESLEVAKFIYDEDEPMWETISFTHLERESSDNTYKKVVNLMTKISR